MKRVSFNIPKHAHFLTFSCYERQQLLADDTLCRHLLLCWDSARRKGEFAIWAYVVMPEHVHLLIWPKSDEYRMASILRLLKEPFARWVAKYWAYTAPQMLERIRVHRGARDVHRFWQEGGGYDRNLLRWQSINEAIEYIEWNAIRRGLVCEPSAWRWLSAGCRPDNRDVLLAIDPIDVEETGG